MNCAVKCWLAGITLFPSVVVADLEHLPVAYLLVAKAYRVPADLLYAVALAESGRHYRDRVVPWPWALNIDGQSVFCESRNEAIARIEVAINQRRPLDIGLMQVSWRWQQQRFSSPHAALTPMHNLKAGAEILREHFEMTGDWWQAVGRYHDPGQDRSSLSNARRYRERVRQHWREHFQ